MVVAYLKINADLWFNLCFCTILSVIGVQILLAVFSSCSFVPRVGIAKCLSTKPAERAVQSFRSDLYSIKQAAMSREEETFVFFRGRHGG